MKTCAVCHEEVTPRMIREGSALSRGADVVHRACHAPGRGRPAEPRPSRTPAGPRTGASLEIPQTSFADVPEPVEYAGFWRRVGAQIVDSFILNAVMFFAAFLFGIRAAVQGPAEPGTLSILAVLVGTILEVVYFVWFWAKTGATPGKMALGVQVVGQDGLPPTGVQSFVRYLGYIVSSMAFGLGYLWMLWDPENRCWHDMMAGTHVVRARV